MRFFNLPPVQIEEEGSNRHRAHGNRSDFYPNDEHDCQPCWPNYTGGGYWEWYVERACKQYNESGTKDAEYVICPLSIFNVRFGTRSIRNTK